MTPTSSPSPTGSVLQRSLKLSDMLDLPSFQEVCQGLYGPDGNKLGELSNTEKHFGDQMPGMGPGGEGEAEGEGGLGVRGRPAGGAEEPEEDDDDRE